MASIGQLLIDWYEQAGRALPWRRDVSPYQIWLSEIILQQTRVAQGAAYFERFRKAFPSVEELAAAPEQAVLKQWEGLGYYSRAKNLHKAAKIITEEYGGKLPQRSVELQKLPGIGPYTANAIASFAFGEHCAVVDGNVFRVLSRLENDPTPIDSSGSRKHFQAIADRWLGTLPAARFNHAIMDFGALLCTPKSPHCHRCPLQRHCKAYAAGSVLQRPVKEKSLRRGKRYFEFYWATRPGGQVAVVCRDDSSFWKNLYTLPWRELPHFKQPPQAGQLSVSLKHEFSHFTMCLRLVVEPGEQGLPASPELQWHSPAAIHNQLPMPRAMYRLLEAWENEPQALNF